MKIGFWGAGTMGSCLARNLLKQGLEVVIYSRSEEKARSPKKIQRISVFLFRAFILASE